MLARSATIDLLRGQGMVSRRGARRTGDDPAAAGPLGGTPYTVYFPRGRGYRAADLEHAAPLPRPGDLVEYIDEGGTAHHYEVVEVTHTLQAAPAARPRVRDRDFPPASYAKRPGSRQPDPFQAGLRSGLPIVILRTTRRRRARPSSWSP